MARPLVPDDRWAAIVPSSRHHGIISHRPAEATRQRKWPLVSDADHVDRERRERRGRDPSPTGVVAERSGSVDIRGGRRYDPARRGVGRKRHMLTDTDGRLLITAVSPAELHDSHGGVALLRASCRPGPFLSHCFADQA